MQTRNLSACDVRWLLPWLLVFLGSDPARVSAAQIFWNNPAGGSFNNASNWQGGMVPNAADQAVFNLSNPSFYTVTAASNNTVSKFIIRSNTVELDLDSTTLTTTSFAIPGSDITAINIGTTSGENANLLIKNGTITGPYAQVGYGNSLASLTLSTSAVLNCMSLGTVNGSTATVTVTNGGSLQSGTVVLAGADRFDVGGTGSQVNLTGGIFAGYFGAAAVSVVAGGKINSADDVTFGYSSSRNLTAISSGGQWDADGHSFLIGNYNSSTSNEVRVADAGSLLKARAILIGNNSHSSDNVMTVENAGRVAVQFMELGAGSSGNQAVVTNGGILESDWGYVGEESGNNRALIHGINSVWSNRFELQIGYKGLNNQMTVSDGAKVFSSDTYMGSWWGAASGNRAVVTGEGSSWRNSGTIFIGERASGNQLLIDQGGEVDTEGLLVGLLAGTSGNSVTVSNGTLNVSTGSSGGVFEVRYGFASLKGGIIDTDILLMTNTSGSFNFSGGMLRGRSMTVSNAATFIVGDGTAEASLDLNGGTHRFANGLVISSNSALKGTGTIASTVNVLGVLAPEPLAHAITFNKLYLSPGSRTDFRFGTPNASGGSSNEVITVAGDFTLSGCLTVTNLAGFGPGTFSLFRYGGAFSNLGMSLGNVPAGFAYALDTGTPGEVSLRVAVTNAIPPPEVLSMKTGSNNLSLSFLTFNLPAYIVEYTDSLDETQWTMLATLPGDGTIQTVMDPSANVPHRFYRLRIE